MNKYFLPVYHSELKPWIKWWILKRLSGGESSLKAITITSGTLTKVDKSKALSIKEYYGNTVQDGTPTPESPVEIQTISGNITFTINGGDYKLDLKSKNLYNKDEDLSGYVLASNGAINSAFNYTVGGYIACKPNTKYTISFIYDTDPTIQSPENIMRIGYFKSDKSFISRPIDSSNPIIITTPSDAYYIRLSYQTSSHLNLQINEGTTALPYESYYNYELCKIGDYKDKIVNVNGTWKIEKNIGKAIYNGTENWYFTSNCCYINNIVDTVKRPANNNTKANILCDHYQIDTLANCYNNVTDKRISVNNGGYVYIYDTSFTSANDIKTWLTTHNTDLYYALATPTTETITNTNLISQLNALYEFYVNSSKVTISNNSEIPLEVLLEYYGR